MDVNESTSCRPDWSRQKPISTGGTLKPHAAIPRWTSRWFLRVGSTYRRRHLRLCPPLSRKPHHRRSFVPFGNFSSFGRLGHGCRHFHVDSRYALAELFFSPTDRLVYHRRPAKLGRPFRLPARFHHRQPAFQPYPSRSRRS